MNAALHALGQPDDRSSKLTHTIISVTPEMAKRWLDNNNNHNRDISEFRVSQYVADMEEDRWKFNGETIQFDRSGMLLNGQHRLMAIFVSGIPQTFLIVRGLDPAAQITMDQGTRRSPKDQLGIAGIQMDSTIAAAIRLHIAWTDGLLFGDQVRNNVTTSHVVQWAQENPDLVRQLRDLAEAGIKRAPCTPSLALAIGLQLSMIDEADCLQFFDKLISRENISGAVLALRNRLDKARDAHVKLTNRDIIGYFTMAWNAYREHRPIQKLQRPQGNVWTPRNFPVPR